jgi:uncharacterized protein YerC
MENFLADLLSPPEIAHARRRWAIAQTLMNDRCSQREAKRRHGGSWDVVRRVHAAVEDGVGYRAAYAALNSPKKLRKGTRKPR